MKKLFAFLVGIFMTLTSCCLAQDVVAVSVNATGTGRRIVEDVRENIISTLVCSNRFYVVERQQLKPVLNELALGTTGLLEPGTETEYGHFTGGVYTLIGNILAADVIDFPGIGYCGRKAKIRCSIKVIDNKTGHIVRSNIITSSSSMLKPRHGSGSRNDRILLSRAAQELAEKVVKVL